MTPNWWASKNGPDHSLTGQEKLLATSEKADVVNARTPLTGRCRFGAGVEVLPLAGEENAIGRGFVTVSETSVVGPSSGDHTAGCAVVPDETEPAEVKISHTHAHARTRTHTSAQTQMLRRRPCSTRYQKSQRRTCRTICELQRHPCTCFLPLTPRGQTGRSSVTRRWTGTRRIRGIPGNGRCTG